MKKDTLDEAVNEARRFIARANDLKKLQLTLERDHADDQETHRLDGLHYNIWFKGVSSHTAAVRRASLDLTRILAKLRQEK